MLVIGRRPQERFVLLTSDGDVWVQVTAIEGRQVKIGIDAPKSVSVHREEIWQAIQDGVERRAEA